MAPGDRILTTGALRALEAADTGHQLMARAGNAGAALAEQIAGCRGRALLILAGPGNNGGDALVVARHLHERGVAVHLVLAGDDARLPADAKHAWQGFLAAGGQVHLDFPDHQLWDLVIDGLFGLGLGRPLSGPYALWIDRLQKAAERSACPLLSLDVPSGLNAETGQACGPVVIATHTLSFLGLKPGLLTCDGPDLCGQVSVAELGADFAALAVLPQSTPNAVGKRLSQADFPDVFAPRRRNSHKGTYGATAILGGGQGMIGAVLLAGRAALKLGAGRVYLAFPGEPPILVDPGQPELMIKGAEDVFAAPLSALACGPGLGQSEPARAMLARAIEQALPLVLDADALNLLAVSPALTERVRGRAAPTVLTPHPGEAARLLGVTGDEIERDRLAAASRIAIQYKAWVVLKGCGSVIVSPNGAWWINPTGNPGLATAGSGDTLSGFLVALLGQGKALPDALLGAVYLHGAAADQLVSSEHPTGPGGTIGLCASELPDAARRLLNRWIAAAEG